jgi:hypothetical protein
LIAFNVVANIDLPAASRLKVRPREAAELGAFLDHAVTDVRFGALFELTAATAVRAPRSWATGSGRRRRVLMLIGLGSELLHHILGVW